MVWCGGANISFQLFLYRGKEKETKERENVMSLLKSIFKSKIVEEGIEKIVQYGKRTLAVMKPEVSEWAVYNGGTTVPKSMMGYYEKAGWKPISTFTKTSKEVLIKNGNTTEKLIITKTNPLTGIKEPRGKMVTHQIYDGDVVRKVATLDATGYGNPTFRSQIFN